MTQLPVTALESEMIACARETLREHRDGFSHGAGRRLMYAMLRQYAEHQPNHLHVAAMARAGFDDADEILRDIANGHIERHEVLPTSLGAYIMECNARFPRHAGRQKSDQIMRDIVIVGAVSAVVHRFGVRATRSRTSRATPEQKLTAAAAVAKALRQELPGMNLGERAIEGIWERLANKVFRWETMLFGYEQPSPV